MDQYKSETETNEITRNSKPSETSKSWRNRVSLRIIFTRPWEILRIEKYNRELPTVRVDFLKNASCNIRRYDL